MDRQRTIRSQATISGIGLQTGKTVTLRLNPAPPSSGATFIRVDKPGAPSVKVSPSSLKESRRLLQRTVLKNGRAEVHTVEHLLASLSGLSIDNIDIEIDNIELPGLDGSAKEFVRVLREAGFQEQDAPRSYLEVQKPIVCANGKGTIQVLPDDRFKVEYYLDYNRPFLKEQWFDIELDSSEDFAEFFASDVAPSRTFCLEEEAMMLLRAGLGKGADLSNTLVIGSNGPIDNEFRFANEPARHKLLDFLGDLYVLGRHIKGRVIAKKSGHKLNNKFVRRLEEELKPA
jgi:UDP-3-O-acyl N-acetylglucosamine deacetylase